MPYDRNLAERVRRVFKARRGIVEKMMFGGLGFVQRDHLVVCLSEDSLIARIGPDAYAAALREPGVREFNLTGRSMTGWVLVTPEVLVDDDELRGWIDRCLKFVKTLPPKAPEMHRVGDRGRPK